MNTQIESKPVDAISEAITKTEHPIQERYCGEVSESVELTAEAVFMARRLEAKGETGPVLVP